MILKSDLGQHEDNTEGALNFCRSDSESLMAEEIVAKMSNINGLMDLVFACRRRSISECHNRSNRSFLRSAESRSVAKMEG